MNNLSLKDLNVQELYFMEMRKIEGGGSLTFIIKRLEAATSRPEDIAAIPNHPISTTLSNVSGTLTTIISNVV